MARVVVSNAGVIQGTPFHVSLSLAPSDRLLQRPCGRTLRPPLTRVGCKRCSAPRATKQGRTISHANQCIPLSPLGARARHARAKAVDSRRPRRPVRHCPVVRRHGRLMVTKSGRWFNKFTLFR